jgi:hypothetical protein
MPLCYVVISIAQIPALADLRDPTVKKCLVVFRELMKTYGTQELHESVLALLGCQKTDQVDVERHYQDLSSIYDRAVEINQSPGIHMDKISEVAQASELASLREMINEGLHREAMFMIVALRAMCRDVCLQDAVEKEKAQHEQQYKKFVAELGIRSKDDIQKRAEDGTLLRDEVMQVAAQIVETNQKIIQ